MRYLPGFPQRAVVQRQIAPVLTDRSYAYHDRRDYRFVAATVLEGETHKDAVGLILEDSKDTEQDFRWKAVDDVSTV